MLKTFKSKLNASERYVLTFQLLESKQELTRGVVAVCIIHMVRSDNQNDFFRILQKQLPE